MASAKLLCTQVASAFLSHYEATGQYQRELIALLCELATSEDEGMARAGMEGIFPFLVERLSDSFNPEYCPLYDRVFAQIVEFCRHLPAGRALDGALKRFGLESEEDLLLRKERLRARLPFPQEEKFQIEKVFVLSRVTLGAEVAITSIILAKMKQLFPQAELVLLAAPTMWHLFGGDHRVRICTVEYNRSGGVIERLNSWLDVLAALDGERKGLRPESYLVIDPDSRLTQLGFFPLVEDESRYYFFESRSYRRPGLGCISRLTMSWLEEFFGPGEEIFPYLSLPQEDREPGEKLLQALRRGGARCLVSANFGVGGNERKRLPDPFEEKLVSGLIESGATVVLGKGVGEEELNRANRLAARLREKGKKVLEVNEGNISELVRAGKLRADFVAWEGNVGVFCALIRGSDEYIGYDSGGQHIAAAQGVPVVDIFVDRSYPLISERWQPYGPAEVRVVKAEPEDTPDDILPRVMQYHREN